MTFPAYDILLTLHMEKMIFQDPKEIFFMKFSWCRDTNKINETFQRKKVFEMAMHIAHFQLECHTFLFRKINQKPVDVSGRVYR